MAGGASSATRAVDSAAVRGHLRAMFRAARATTDRGPTSVVLELVLREPDTTLVVRANAASFEVCDDGAPLVADVRLSMRADLADTCWRGDVELAECVACGDICAEGPVNIILALLPRLRALVPHYRASVAEWDRLPAAMPALAA